MTKLEAIARGAKRYTSDNPCPYGHFLRYVVGGCVECKDIKRKSGALKDYMRQYYSDNNTTMKTQMRDRYYRNLDSAKEYNKKYYRTHREREIARAKVWHTRNPEKARASTKKYRSKNPKLFVKYQADRRARKRQATLPLTPGQKDWMKFIYEKCPPGYEVDHIHPLAGENLCGLHVPWNLQHLPMPANRSKSNKVLAA